MLTGGLAGLLVALGCAGPPALERAASIDLEAYQGRWYEVARLPNRYERGCTAVTADYTLRDDGVIEVVNRCRMGTTDGPLREARGIARVVDGAQLEVQFLWPFRGDYQILAVDEGAYSLVGSRGRRSLWILSRTPELDEARVDALLDEAARQGFDVGALEWTEH